MRSLRLIIEPLTHSAFAPFGQVIAMADERLLINSGTVRRIDHIAKLDLDANGGQPLLSLMRADPCRLPLRVRMLERHPVSSQAFIPLSQRPFLVVVARPGDTLEPEDVHAFRAEVGQGVNYARGVWHHPLLALDEVSDFAVIGRGASDENCDFFHIGRELIIDDAV